MEHISKLPGLRQTYNRAQMTATLHVMKIVPKWAPLHICTDSQLVVDTVVYWMAGWARRGWKTKTGKLVENADLWQAVREELESRTGQTWWIKVPSHTDIEGNDQADVLAKKGVQQHGVKLQEEKGQEERPTKKRGRERSGERSGQRSRERSGGNSKERGRSAERNKMVRSRKRKAKQEEEDVMPKAKRERRSAVQGLIDPGTVPPWGD